MSIEQTFTPVEAVKPVAAYVGGKRKLAKTISQLILEREHKIYAEPFVGMGGVFLQREHKPKSEVINDVNKELVTFFRVLSRHYPQFMDTLKFQICSRADFERLQHTDPETLTDLERAARFLYLQRIAFGGKSYNQTFGVSPDRPSRFDVNKLTPLLADLNERMNSVVIECLPYLEFIEKYDSPETLFYLDPPYFGTETIYGLNFSRNDFAVLAEALGKLKGRFLLSINDRPEIREIFSSFDFVEVETSYSLARQASGRRKFGELIFMN